MNYLFRVSKPIVFVIMISVVTGCAFAGKNVPETTLVESTAKDQTKPTLSYEINDFSVNEMDSWFLAYTSIKNELPEELYKSQYFKEITEENSAVTDIELNVTLTTTSSGCTTNHYEVIVRVKNKKGLEKVYVLNDRAFFPLACLYGSSYIDESEGVRPNMYRNIIQQMYEDGFMGES